MVVTNTEADGLVFTVNGSVLRGINSIELLCAKNGYRLNLAEFAPDPKKGEDDTKVSSAVDTRQSPGQYL